MRKDSKAVFLHNLQEKEVLMIYIYNYIFSVVLEERMLELNKGCGVKSAVWEPSLEIG